MAFDINKEINEMKRELSLKLSKFAVGEDVIEKYIEFSSPEIADKAKKLWKRYTEKFNKSSNIQDKEQALIKMYSNYKALKVIGNVCKDIIEETNFGKKKLKPNKIKEFMGALDVAKLAKEQKKFELRAKHGKFSIKDGEAKVAEILNARKKMQADTLAKNPKDYKVLTPFGEITISCEFNDEGKTIQTRMIRLPGQTNNEPYTEMAKLDNALNKLDLSVKKALIKCIKDYINQKVQFNENDDANVLLQKINPSTFTGFDNLEEKVKNEAKNAAAILCGCLLFAESSQIRNPTRGKLEKKAVKKVEKLIKQNCTNPFGVVFAGQAVDDPSAIDDKNKLYTPAKSVGGQKKKPWLVGGQYQTEWLITGKATIKDHLLSKKESENYDILKVNMDKLDNIILEKFKELILSTAKMKDIPNQLRQKFPDVNIDLIDTSINKKLYKLYFMSDKSHEKIKIKNIPDDFKTARDHMLKSIKENRKNLHELNKK